MSQAEKTDALAQPRHKQRACLASPIENAQPQSRARRAL
jgi:hypothetical protein